MELHVVALGRRRLGPHAARRAARARCRAASRRRTTPCRSARGRCRPSRRGTRPCRPSARSPPCRRRTSRCRPSGSASGRAGRAPYRCGRPAPIMSGVATTLSNSSQLSSWIFFTSSSPPTKSAPASSRLVRLFALGEDQRRALTCRCRAAARPCRARSDRPGAGSTPSRTAISTVSSNLASLPGRREFDRLVERIALLAVDLGCAPDVSLAVPCHRVPPVSVL